MIIVEPANWQTRLLILCKLDLFAVSSPRNYNTQKKKKNT